MDRRITGSVLLIIFKSLISLCFITCLIRISLNLKNDQKNRPHDPDPMIPLMLSHCFSFGFIPLKKVTFPLTNDLILDQPAGNHSMPLVWVMTKWKPDSFLRISMV